MRSSGYVTTGVSLLSAVCTLPVGTRLCPSSALHFSARFSQPENPQMRGDSGETPAWTSPSTVFSEAALPLTAPGPACSHLGRFGNSLCSLGLGSPALKIGFLVWAMAVTL